MSTIAMTVLTGCVAGTRKRAATATVMHTGSPAVFSGQRPSPGVCSPAESCYSDGCHHARRTCSNRIGSASHPNSPAWRT
ncbi:hypothetical protein, partial [Streptomyces sp. NPDC002221]|uniref:hypothetical protein n=1 Tax=Streptomyces sp. NPDC002221 TaxID=3364639 RepID=UPI0036AB3A81